MEPSLKHPCHERRRAARLPHRGTKERSGKSAQTPEAFIESLSEPRRGQVRELHEVIRKATISLHVLAAYESGYLAEAYKYRLPKADIGKSCVRFKKLDDVDVGVLEELIRKGSNAPPPGAIEG